MTTRQLSLPDGGLVMLTLAEPLTLDVIAQLERLTGRGAGEESGVESLIYRALKEDIVVPLREPLSAELAVQIAEQGIEIESLTVVRNQDKFQLEDGITGNARALDDAQGVGGCAVRHGSDAIRSSY